MINKAYLTGIRAGVKPSEGGSLDWLGLNHYARLDVSSPTYSWNMSGATLYSATCEANSWFPGTKVSMPNMEAHTPNMEAHGSLVPK